MFQQVCRIGLLCLLLYSAGSAGEWATSWLTADGEGALTATFLGGGEREGNNDHVGFRMTRDPWGHVFVVGMTLSSDFPTTPGAYDRTRSSGYDVYIAKLSSDLSTLLASTFLGSFGDEEPWAVTCDAAGNVYVSGVTTSTTFPTTPGAYSASRSGANDGFISRFDNNLTTLLSSTYLGGSGSEGRVKLALDSDGNVFVAGTTSSLFPTTVGCYDNSYAGNQDFFVAKLNAGLTDLLASTYLGGSYLEVWPSIAIDAANNVVISGSSGSSDYPTSIGAYDQTLNGLAGNGWDNLDVVVTRLNNALTDLLSSTYVGSGGYEGGLQLTLDDNGNIYVAGHVLSSTYPVTTGVLDEVHSGDEYYVSRFDPDLTNLVASTFIRPGDAGPWSIWGMAHDGQGGICFTGIAAETGMLTTAGAFDRTYNGGWDGVVVRISDDLTSVSYATYLGGSGDDGGSEIVIADDGAVYVYGFAGTPGFPVTSGGYDDGYNGGATDAFVARLSLDQFTRITNEPVVTDSGWSFGASWVDYDSDGHLDLMVSNWDWAAQGGFVLNYLYHNNGGDTFTRFSRIMTGPVAADGNSLASTWADCDNDGDVDGYVSGSGTVNHFYINEGDSGFNGVTSGPLVSGEYYTMGAMWVDYDNDGWLDLFVVNHRPPGDPPVQNELFRNDAGVFVKQNNATIGLVTDEGNGAAWGDIDGDGDLDLFVTRNDKNSLLYANDGDGTFTLLTGSLLTNEDTHYGNFADYDNDGDLDMYAGVSYPGTFRLYQNDGAGNFVDVAAQAVGNDPGYWTGGYWADCDNDGDLDLLLTANYFYQSLPNRLYVNDGDGTFTIETGGIVATDSEASSCGAWGDLDRDGDLDLFVANVGNQNNTLYANNGNTNHWLQVVCVGTRSNRSAIGTKVRVKAHLWSQDVWQRRDIRSQSGFLSQDQMAAHFGLGDAVIVDSLKLEWPSGIVQVIENVPVDQFLTVYEQCCEGRVGDANGSGEDEPTISDISVLIDAKFISGSCEGILACLTEADINQSGGMAPDCGDITISDISVLIDYLFITGQSLGLPECL